MTLSAVLTFLHHYFILHFGKRFYSHSSFYAAHCETSAEVRRRVQNEGGRRGEGGGEGSECLVGGEKGVGVSVYLRTYVSGNIDMHLV